MHWGVVMRSFSGVERMVNDLEREARQLRGETNRLHEQFVEVRKTRIELATRDSRTWHGVRFAVQVVLALGVIAALAVTFAVVLS